MKTHLAVCEIITAKHKGCGDVESATDDEEGGDCLPRHGCCSFLWLFYLLLLLVWQLLAVGCVVDCRRWGGSTWREFPRPGTHDFSFSLSPLTFTFPLSTFHAQIDKNYLKKNHGLCKCWWNSRGTTKTTLPLPFRLWFNYGVVRFYWIILSNVDCQSFGFGGGACELWIYLFLSHECGSGLISILLLSLRELCYYVGPT